MQEQSQIHIIGKNGISAKILKDSISPGGNRLTTFELEYPRMILAEVNTHKMLSKSSESSRAVPIATRYTQIQENTARPVHWGKNQSGMSAKEELDDLTKNHSLAVWDGARDIVIAISKILAQFGVHKQIANRVTEPFMMQKTVLSGTEFANVWWLRDHSDAQPEFHELAHCMHTAYDMSTPELLYTGEWHLPYVRTHRNENNFADFQYFVGDEKVPLDIALKVSASCCAQASYRKLDDTIEKALSIYDRLITSVPVHASPTEHQGTPMKDEKFNSSMIFNKWEEGVTHLRNDGSFWSANYRGWIQYRQTIPGNTKW